MLTWHLTVLLVLLVAVAVVLGVAALIVIARRAYAGEDDPENERQAVRK